jgi:hypothetical protein
VGVIAGAARHGGKGEAKSAQQLTVYSYGAKKVVVMIVNDMKRGLVPETVRSFSELHDSVDANQYLETVAILGTGDNWDAMMEKCNSISDEVDA